MNPFFYILPLIALPIILGDKENYTYGNPSDYPTWDVTTSKNIAALHPAIRKKAKLLVDSAYTLGYKVRITSGLRSWKEQKKIYAVGRTTGKKGSIISKARPGRSYHNYGLAIDLFTYNPYSLKKNKWTYHTPDAVVTIAKKIGFSWGGDFPGTFKDYPHLQYSKIGINTLESSWKKKQRTADGYVALSGFSGLSGLGDIEDPFKSAYDWAINNLVGQTFSHPELPDKFIIVTKKGIRHAIFSRRNSLDALFTYSLPDSFINSVLYRTDKDKNNSSKNTYKFRTVWTLNGKDYKVLFVLKSLKSDVLYYDHAVFPL